MRDSQFTLAIETAIQGGSISLLRGDLELDNWIGTQEVSKSEDVLNEIKKILERNNLEKRMIEEIVVSRGPGSYTGVRIGMSIALGLKKALDCRLSAASTLEAMLYGVEYEKKDFTGGIATAIPIGRNQICWQNFQVINRFEILNRTQPKFSTIDCFLNDYFKDTSKKRMILHRKLFRAFRFDYENSLPTEDLLIDAGENIAFLIARMRKKIGNKNDTDKQQLSPIYIKDSVMFGGD